MLDPDLEPNGGDKFDYAFDKYEYYLIFDDDNIQKYKVIHLSYTDIEGNKQEANIDDFEGIVVEPSPNYDAIIWIVVGIIALIFLWPIVGPTIGSILGAIIKKPIEGIIYFIIKIIKAIFNATFKAIRTILKGVIDVLIAMFRFIFVGIRKFFKFLFVPKKQVTKPTIANNQIKKKSK